MKQMRSLKDVGKVVSGHASVWIHLACVSYLYKKNDYPLDDYIVNKNNLLSDCSMLGSVLNEYRHQLIYSSQEFYQGSAIRIPILEEENKAQRG